MALIKTVDQSVLRRYVRAMFESAGSCAGEAAIVADHLVDANLKGHDSHGAIRAAKYVDWVASGQLFPNRHAQVVTDRAALIVVDGRFGYGQVIGKEAMALATERAALNGFCAIGIRNSGHLGRIGAWAEQLADAGLVSFHFVNTSGFGILVAPHGGSDRRLSANPVAAGVPVMGKAPIILDIATSIVAEGKIQVARNRGEKLKPGLVVDGAGEPTTDPERFYSAPPGAILPFGAHKGYGLSFMCEVLAGSLTGGSSSHPNNPTASRLVNNMLTVVFDPVIFPTDVFDEDVSRLINWTKGSPSSEPGGEVLLPGEIEARTEAVRLKEGIPLDEETIRQIGAAARRLHVAIPSVLEVGHA